MREEDVRAVRSLFSRRPASAPQSVQKSAAEAQGAAPRVEKRADDYVELKARLHGRMIADLQEDGLLGADPSQLEGVVEEWVADVLPRRPFPSRTSGSASRATSRRHGPRAAGPLLADPAITDILVNGHDQVFVERFGRLEEADVRFADDDHLRRMIERLALTVGRRIDQSSPMVDMRLADGSRVNATIPPVSIDGPALSIRRFGRNRLRSTDVIKLRMFSEAMWTVLGRAVAGRTSFSRAAPAPASRLLGS